MLTDQRQQMILGELARNGAVVSAELARRFGLSEDTIRRDLRELARGGACRRVYGGAVASGESEITPDTHPRRADSGTIAQRSTANRAEKARLAAAAVALIQPRQSLFIDSGSTNIAIAHAIPHDLPLTVATNALEVANALAGRPAVELILLGGRFERSVGVCVGGDTLRALAGLSADLCFLGSCGLDPARGATAFREDEAEVKRAMLASSAAVAVAAVHTKLGSAAPWRVCGIEGIAHLIVDSAVPQDDLTPYEAAGTTIHRTVV